MTKMTTMITMAKMMMMMTTTPPLTAGREWTRSACWLVRHVNLFLIAYFAKEKLQWNLNQNEISIHKGKSIRIWGLHKWQPIYIGLNVLKMHNLATVSHKIA